MTDMILEKTTGAEEIVWDLSIFYSGVDDPAIERDMDAIAKDVAMYVARYRGRVAAMTAAEFVEAIQMYESLLDAAGRIQSFAFLNFATDTNKPEFGALVQRVTEWISDLQQETLFFNLEWKALEDAAAQRILDDPTLGKYHHTLEAERRYKPYTLSEKEEQILIDKSVTGRTAWTRLFTQIMGAARFDFDGKQLTQSQVLKLLYEPARDIRHAAADSITKTLREKSMELTYIFNTLVADKASEDKRRGFPSWISERNLDNKAPDAVVDALVSAVTPDSPASKGGLEAGDVILRFDGKDVNTMRGLPKIVAQTPIGKSVDVEVLRRGEKKTLKVAVGRLTEDEEVAANTPPVPPKPTEDKSPEKKHIGLTVTALTDELRSRFGIDGKIKGVVVLDVDAESPAAAKGIKPGDVIVEAGQDPVASPDDLIKSVDKVKKSGRKAVLLRVEDGKGDLRFIAVPLVP